MKGLRFARCVVLFVLLALSPCAMALAQTATPTPIYGTFAQIGTVQMLAGSPDDGWLVCDGSAVSRATYDRLFAVIGTTFGAGDGSTTFNLPDLRGRVPVGSGQGAGLTNRILAQTMGEETHMLTITEMPSHNHTVSDPGHNHTERGGNGANAFIAGGGSNVTMGTGINGGATQITTNSSQTNISINSTGGGAAFNQMQPSLVLNYVIWTGVTELNISPPEEISVTVVIAFPSHTPTPTPTPTLTPTDGPSPTPTPTATNTPNFLYLATVEVEGTAQDVGVIYQVTAGEVMVSLLLSGVLIALVVLIGLQIIRGRHVG